MFCVKCGKPAVADNLCEKCFLLSASLFEIKNFEAGFCRQCGNFHKGPIEDQIRSKIKSKHKITKCDITTKRVGNRILVTVNCSGYIKPLKHIVHGERKSIVIVKNRKCENCIKISGGYYEAVLQARGEHTERISKKIMSMAKESVVSVKQLKEGYDILLTDKKIAAKIATQLGNYFDIRSSYKFVGEKKGKKLYRNYYAIR